MSDGALSVNSLEVGEPCPKTWENMEGLWTQPIGSTLPIWSFLGGSCFQAIPPLHSENVGLCRTVGIAFQGSDTQMLTLKWVKKQMVPSEWPRPWKQVLFVECSLHLLKYMVPPSFLMINLQGLHQRPKPTYGAIHYGYSLGLECTLEAHVLKVRFPANWTIGRWWNY
jgi:hypothetical protein